MMIYLIDILDQIEEEKIDYDASFLLSLRKTLFEAGSRIVDKNDILTERMSKVIAQSERSDRRGIEKLFSLIKAESASLLQNNTDTSSIVMNVDETKPALSFPLARTLVSINEERKSQDISFEEKKNNLSSILALKNEFHVNEQELLSNILTYSKENGLSVFTLKELFSHFPVSKGLEEVVAYLSVIKENYKNSSINE